MRPFRALAGVGTNDRVFLFDRLFMIWVSLGEVGEFM